MKWTQHPIVPNVSYAPTLTGGYYGKLTRSDGTTQVIEVTDQRALELLAAEWSTSDEHIPVGDIIASITKKLGIKKCLPCAKRQQQLNRWLKR